MAIDSQTKKPYKMDMTINHIITNTVVVVVTP